MNNLISIDVDVLEESALAMAQATIQNAIDDSHLSRAEMARRMGRNRALVSRMLRGSHNLTVRTMARALAVCGFEMHFERVPITWNWVEGKSPTQKKVGPANAGTTMPVLLRKLA
jgi:hypothetical protein